MPPRLCRPPQDNPGELLRAARAVAAEAYDRDTLMKVGGGRVGCHMWCLP